MDPITQQTVLAAAGAAGGDPVYVDDVFSTYLWNGNYDTTRSAISINNGIDLSGEGGLVWTKNRNYANHHQLYDTERNAGNLLYSSLTNGQSSNSVFNSFTSNGFSLTAGTAGTDALNGDAADTYASWTFRKAPGFFDVVTYTGTGSARTVAHSLGSVPGMIIIKQTSATESWYVYHRSIGNDKHLILSSGNPEANSSAWNDTTPTSTNFTVSNDDVNQNNETYVAYIFAHDDAQFGTDSDESIIKCGTYTGNNTTNAINVGFEPQFFMVKNTTSSGNWAMVDIMRGAADNDTNQPFLYANDNAAENFAVRAYATSNGFGYRTEAASDINQSGNTYIYMAIRRPNKPPEAATDVFAIDVGNSSSTIPAFDSGFPVDFAFRLAGYASGGNNPRALSRLQGPKELYTSLSNGEANNSDTVWDSMSGFEKTYTSNDIAWMFKRAPGFMDVVAYSGDSSSQNVSHKLSVIPELIIVKRRNLAEDWAVYHSDLGANKYLKLNQNGSFIGSNNIWSNTSPTSSVFTVGTDGSVNLSGNTFMAYLFATLPGISKVGSYTGTGSAINVDCGFTSGARFVLIKRTDNGGNWFVLDTVRGIVSGNDPLLELNSTSAQDSAYDNLDPYSQGFTVTAYGGTSPYLNISGGTYMFLAIA